MKSKPFSWTKERENSYQAILARMSDLTTLRPFDPDRETHFVSDGSQVGISAILYQENDDVSWFPVDHTSRALSEAEQRWKSQINWESKQELGYASIQALSGRDTLHHLGRS